MEYALALEYYTAINVIEAQEALLTIKVADYPRATKDSRSRFHRELRKEAYPPALQKEMDFDEFFKEMSGGR